MPNNNSSKQKGINQRNVSQFNPAEVAEILEGSETSAGRIGLLLTRADFARALNLCSHSIQRMERRGLIRAIRINSRVIRYPISELERLLQEASL
jgi:hypothetical protein